MGLVAGDGLGVEAGAVVRHAHLPAVPVFPGGDRHRAPPVRVPPDAVPHGVFHDGLQRQGGEQEIRTGDLVCHLQGVLEADLLQVQIDPRVGKLFFKRDQVFPVQGVHVAAQVLGKLDRRLLGRHRVAVAQRLDGPERVIEEVGLDLAHHELDPLLCRQVLLVRPDKVQMQPVVIQHAVDHNGQRQKADWLGQAAHVPVQEKGKQDQQRRKGGDPRDPFLHLPELLQRAMQKVGQQKQADGQAALPERPHAVPVDRNEPARMDHGRPDAQQVFQIVLGDQAEHQRDQQQHGPLLPFPDVIIVSHRDG